MVLGFLKRIRSQVSGDGAVVSEEDQVSGDET